MCRVYKKAYLDLRVFERNFKLFNWAPSSQQKLIRERAQRPAQSRPMTHARPKALGIYGILSILLRFEQLSMNAKRKMIITVVEAAKTAAPLKIEVLRCWIGNFSPELFAS